MPTTLTTWLLAEDRAGRIDLDMYALLTSVATACKTISALVKAAPLANNLGVAGDTNASGDEQKKLDVIANDVFCRAVASCGRASITVTEEEETPIAVESVAGNYICCFDPIDGSSNLDACISTGSIFGIYSQGECVIDPADDADAIATKCITNVRKAGTDLVAAGYCMYSSSTVLVLTLGHGVYGFTLDTQSGEFWLSHDNIKIPDPGSRQYSGNLGNVALWAPELREYVTELSAPSAPGAKPYAYRYIGALCPDFHRVLLYGGIWLYPPDIKAPQGKARLLYEVAPMSYIAEQAGGLACVGPLADQRVLEVVPEKVHQKSPLFVGSASEVRKLQAFLKAKQAAAASKA